MVLQLSMKQLDLLTWSPLASKPSHRIGVHAHTNPYTASTRVNAHLSTQLQTGNSALRMSCTSSLIHLTGMY